MEQDIYINTIHLDRAHLRTQVTEESVKQLADSIRSHGLLQAIVVAPRTGGGWRLIAGRRRLLAAQLLEFTTIPARIMDTNAPDELPALAENLMRLNMNPLEEAQACKLLQEKHNMSIKEICEQTNHGTSWVQDRLALLALPPNFQEAVALKHIGISAAMMLQHITDIEYRDYLLHIAKVNGATIHQTEAWVLEWDARRRLAATDTYGNPIPQPPAYPLDPTTRCEGCRQIERLSNTMILRFCRTCKDEIDAAHTKIDRDKISTAGS